MKLNAISVLATAVLASMLTAAEPGLTLSVTGSKEPSKTGSEVVVKLNLKNSSDHEINLVATMTTFKNRFVETHFRATVKDSSGKAVPYTKHGKEVWGAKACPTTAAIGSGTCRQAQSGPTP